MLSQGQADRLAVDFKEKLEAVSIDELATESGFVKRKPKKLAPLQMLLGFFKTTLTGCISYRAQAISIGLAICCTVSKQAIHKRIKAPFLKFIEFVLAAVLAEKIKDRCKIACSDALKKFKRVLLQDSTTIAVDAKLAKSFPGSKNRTNKETAILRVQAVVDILTEKFRLFKITAFTNNDQSASPLILDIIEKGDLILRDLGYLVLSVLTAIQLRGAFYISRLKYGICLYEADGQTPLNLLKKLKKNGFFDEEIYAGKKEKVRCRLVAIPLPEVVAAERRRKAKADRDRRRNPSKEYLQLLGWEIFITNVDYEILNTRQIGEIYELRWRIETIFKSWKSNFNLAKVPKGTAIRVQSHVYATLIFITIFQTQIFVRLYKENQKRNKRQLSLFKVSSFLKEHLWAIVLLFQDREITPEEINEQIFYHCTYESRGDRTNYAEKLEKLS